MCILYTPPKFNIEPESLFPRGYPPGNKHILPKWHFEDDFPFPKVGYVSSLEGIFSGSMLNFRVVYTLNQPVFFFILLNGCTQNPPKKNLGAVCLVVKLQGCIWFLTTKNTSVWLCLKISGPGMSSCRMQWYLGKEKSKSRSRFETFFG